MARAGPSSCAAWTASAASTCARKGRGPSDDRSVRAIAAWHVDVVRLPLNESCWLGIGGVPAAYAGAAYQRAITAYVELLNAHGMAVILDLAGVNPGQWLLHE